jgi:hypothetical protein
MQSRYFNQVLYILLLFNAFIVSQRNFEIGADTDSYKYYHSFIIDADSYNPLALEPAFYILYRISIFITDNFRFFLFLEYILFNILYYIFYRRITVLLNQKYSYIQTLTFIGFTLISSWYLLYSLNGLRQGLATPIIYLSFILFIKRKYIQSIILILVATAFHSMSILLFPFFIFYKFNFKTVFTFFLVFAFFYFIYLNNLILQLFCNSVGLSSLYQFIINYGGPEAPDRGPVIKFLLYTLGMPSIFFLISRKILNKTEQINFKHALKFYFILCFPYFFLAYGGYSGRLALYSWFLVPYLYSFIISRSNIIIKERIMISLSIFIFGLFSYILLLNSDKLPIYFRGIWGNV